ncbi:Rod shape-determining protein RodA [bacterium BMS3Abin04]|nr:Rod shape-determining protein RodA [bacterium BMS3Abin04]
MFSKLEDKFDFSLFVPIIILTGIGLLAIYSSTYNHPTASGNFIKQVYFSFISLGAFFFFYFLPHKSLKLIAGGLYAFSILLLLAVIALGKTVYGAKSWISFGSIGFQPSEFAKVGLIFFLAYWLSYKNRNINNLKDISVALAIGMIPVALIMLEPDLGTAIVFIIITFTMIFWSGLNLFAFFVVASPVVIVFASMFGLGAIIISLGFVLLALYFFKRDIFTSLIIFVFNLASSFFFDYIIRYLKPHQQKRIESFVNPAADPLGSGYNALQAKVAIGSGGLFGKGFLHGSQTQLRFIPEQWTDFIYCVIGEEFGFWGSVITISLFFIVFLRFLNIISSVKDKFSSLVLVGILTLLFTHFSINIGMNIGITPVIGLPLPFLSYGGSSLLVNMSLIGIAMNIYKNRRLYT